MKYKLVIFDFDGTLADSLPWYMGIANDVADKYRFKRVDLSELETLRGYSAKQIIRHLGIPWWKMPLIANHMRRAAAGAITNIALFDGVDRLLRGLSDAGVMLALVTSNSYDNVRHVLGPQNAALITYYECDVALFAKHARFRKILRQSGVSPRDALSIGDEIRDFEAARKVNVPFGAVAWGYTTLDALNALAPAATFTSVDDILALVTGKSPANSPA